MVAILGYSREQIFDAVQSMYTAVADRPWSEFHFPVGRDACSVLGYPQIDPDNLPEPVVASFAGVGHPTRADLIGTGDRVLDLGAGAGVDTLLAARRTGPQGRVTALDLTWAMARKLCGEADAAGVENIDVVQGGAEALPFADESFDVITSNGALNLVPNKRRAIGEMFRVLRPGGRLQLADVVIRRPVTVDCESDPRLWVECVVGATVDDELKAMFADAGFDNVRVLREFDYFAHSPSAQTREVAAGFGARSMELTMERGETAPSRLRQWFRRADPRRVGRMVRRRGLAGVTSLFLALTACYGTLLVMGLLAMSGLGIGLNDTAWAGAILVFAALAAAVVVAGRRRHRQWGPTISAGVGTAVIGYALLIDYRFLTELAGFVLIGAGAGWDLWCSRREQQRILGLRVVPGVSTHEARPPR